MKSLVHFSQTWQCFDFENLLHHRFCHSPRTGFFAGLENQNKFFFKIKILSRFYGAKQLKKKGQ